MCYLLCGRSKQSKEDNQLRKFITRLTWDLCHSVTIFPLNFDLYFHVILMCHRCIVKTPLIISTYYGGVPVSVLVNTCPICIWRGFGKLVSRNTSGVEYVGDVRCWTRRDFVTQPNRLFNFRFQKKFPNTTLINFTRTDRRLK